MLDEGSYRMKKLFAVLFALLPTVTFASARLCVFNNDVTINHVLGARTNTTGAHFRGMSPAASWTTSTANLWGLDWEHWDNFHVQIIGTSACDSTTICACQAIAMRGGPTFGNNTLSTIASPRVTSPTSGALWQGTMGNVTCTATRCGQFCARVAGSANRNLLINRSVFASTPMYISLCGANSACPANYSPVTSTNHAGPGSATVVCDDALGTFNASCGR